MTSDELTDAIEEYVARFGVEPPIPFAVSDYKQATVIRAAVAEGRPISRDFDWYDDLPDGANA